MSIIEKIVEQDSLLENSQIQLFIEPTKSKQLKCSTALYPAQVIPSIRQRAFSLSKQLSSRNLFDRCNSAAFSHSAAFSQRKFSATKLTIRNLFTASRQTKTSNFKDSIIRPLSQIKKTKEPNINIQKVNQLIDFNRILALKARKVLPIGLTRKLSGSALAAKSKVEYERKIIQKKLIRSPFEPHFIQSQYLE